MSDIFDNGDDLSDLIGSEVRSQPVVPPATFQPKTFTEKCPKCGGSGRFVSFSSGRDLGPCFKCKGQGSQTFKTSFADREAARDRAADKRAQSNRELTDQIRAWGEEHKAEREWLAEGCVRAARNEAAGKPVFDFPVKLVESLGKFGSLTDGQLAAVRKLMARDAERAEQRKAQATQAPVGTAGIDRLKAAFDQAVCYSLEKGLKLSPRITIDGVTISPAKANSANPGALYVKAGQTYLGKIKDGQFFASRDCTPEQQAKVLEFIRDPAEAAKVYGQTTGTCCICGATLRSEWKHRGIGPICAEKFGF